MDDEQRNMRNTHDTTTHRDTINRNASVNRDSSGSRYFIWGGIALLAVLLGFMFLADGPDEGVTDLEPAAGYETTTDDTYGVTPDDEFGTSPNNNNNEFDTLPQPRE